MPQPTFSTEGPDNASVTTNPAGVDTETMTSKISQAIDDAGGSKGSSAATETKAGVAQAASEVEKAADKFYRERMEDEYAKREGGA